MKLLVYPTVHAILLLLLAGCAATSVNPSSDDPKTASTVSQPTDTGDVRAEKTSSDNPRAATQSNASNDQTEPGGGPENPTPERAIPQENLLPLLQAEFALRQQRLDEALELLSVQALLLDEPELARRALRLAEYQNNDSVALAMAIRLSQLDDQDAAAAATAMGLLLRQGDTVEALTYARAVKERGARVNAPALMVDYSARSGIEQAALANGIQALARDWPQDIDIVIALTLLRREQGNREEALRVLETLLSDHPGEERALVLWTQTKQELGDKDAFERIDSAVSKQPDNEGLRLQYARLLASDNRIDAARDQFLRLQELSPRNGDYLFSLALIELEAGQYDRAKGYLEDLLALQQRVDEAWYYLGRVAEDTGDIAGAIENYRQIGPGREYLDGLRRAGDLLLDDGDVVGFQNLFNTARVAMPGMAEQLFALEARLLQGRDYYSEAIDAYSEGLTIFADSIPLHYGRAMAQEVAGNIALMEQDLRAILAREPDNATTLNALGYTLTTHTRRYTEAAALIERAIELAPGEPAILDSLGWVYFKLGRVQEALVILGEAYQRLPDPEVAAHLGEVLWTLSRPEEALQIWQAALAAHPDNEDVIRTMDRLNAAKQDIE